MEPAASDEELMRRYRDGDTRAFDALYARHKGPLYRYLYRLCAPAAVAEELFQEVWLNVIRARGAYEARAKFTTWLYRLAHHRLIDHYRRRRAAIPIVDDEPALAAVSDEPLREPENELERRRLSERLVQSLADLPTVQREVFLLRQEGGLSLQDIARVTGVDVETAKSRWRYALAKLRRALAPVPLTRARGE